MKVTMKGTPPWIGTYHCDFCDSAFELHIEDGRDISRIEPYPYADVVRRVSLYRCPVCGQRRLYVDPWFDRVGDVGAPEEAQP